MTFPTAAAEDFLYACSELRKLGCTQVRMGNMSAEFAPAVPAEQVSPALAKTIPAPTQTRVPHTKSEPESDVERFPEDTPEDVERRRTRRQLTELVSGT
jgi:hypothetical protein